MKVNYLHQEKRKVRLGAIWGYYSGLSLNSRKKALEYLIIFTAQKDEKVLDIYKNRWQIEHFFKAIKSAGFNRKDTHLKKYERLHKLMILVAILGI